LSSDGNDSLDHQSPYALAYRESDRALSEQQQVLNQLWARAGTVIAATAVSTSFLGGIVLDRYRDAAGWQQALAVGGLAFFILTMVLGLWTLWPWHGWKFAADGQTLVQWVDAEKADLDRMHKNLALQQTIWWHENHALLTRLFTRFRLAIISLLLEIVLWLAVVIGGVG